VTLNIYRHKGYWYHGKNREHKTMLRFPTLIGAGDTVFEIGGHIGYISQYFSLLVGGAGKVVVFEPGTNNLPYLERNVGALANVRIERAAVAEKSGKVAFYVEDITGQNNSLSDHYDVFYANRDRAYSIAEYRETYVDCVALDDFVAASGLRPDFIKIDVEGAEFRVLSGMKNLMASKRPRIMVEVTADNERVQSLFSDARYALSDEAGRPTSSLAGFRGNLFAVPIA
jgi:FkbM family methyltransferase